MAESNEGGVRVERAVRPRSWTSINEQAPTENQQCLVWLSEHKAHAFGIWTEGRWFDGGMFGGGDWFTERVTHWVPLPEPPAA